MNSFMRIGACVAAGFAAVVISGCSKSTEPEAEEGSQPVVESTALESPEPAVEPTTFATPEEGATAMITALRAADRNALAGIFGVDYDEFVPPEDMEVERADVEKFLAAYDESHKMITDTPGKAVLAVGPDSWEFPIPLAEADGKWTFDLDAGRDQIAIRRIGRNELAVIQTVLAYGDAQREYATQDRNGDKILEYAQKILSTEGQKDGLYWPGEGADLSPIGPLLVDDVAVAGEPYHGYRYRILTAQGPSAPGGERSYILGKRMSGGFGLVAWPATYGETGIMTFIMNHDGVVYEKDLGEDTETAVAGVTTFNPDDTWKAVEPEA